MSGEKNHPNAIKLGIYGLGWNFYDSFKDIVFLIKFFNDFKKAGDIKQTVKKKRGEDDNNL